MRTIKSKIKLSKKKYSIRRKLSNHKKSLTKLNYKYFLVHYSQKGGILCKNKIGSGDYGDIYSCYKDTNVDTSNEYQEPFAVKKMLTNTTEEAATEFKNEIQIMKLLRGKMFQDYILQIIELDGAHNNSQPNFYSEYCNLGNLTDFYTKNNKYKKTNNPTILHHILQGLGFLYDNSVIHSDIRTDNILVHEKNGKILYKIADFGKAFKIEPSGIIDFNVIPYSNVAVPKLLLYTTYFRDLYGWFLILLHLYGDILCHYFTGRDTVLYPIKFSDEVVNEIVKKLYNLQKILIDNSYRGENKVVHHEILDESTFYELQGDPSCPIKKSLNSTAPPPRPPKSLPSIPSNSNTPAPPPRPPKSLPSIPSNSNLPPPIPTPRNRGNNTIQNINIQTDRAIYEPVYQEIKKILQIA